MRGLQPPTHLLVAFVATAQFGSFTRAASALHLTQSAVSKQIRELERLTGVRLFERMRHILKCAAPHRHLQKAHWHLKRLYNHPF